MPQKCFRKNVPFVSHVADKFCLFFKKLKKKSIFVHVVKIFAKILAKIFTNFVFIFVYFCKNKNFHINPTYECLMEMMVRSVFFLSGIDSRTGFLFAGWLAKSNSDENIGEVLLSIVSTKPKLSKIYGKKKNKVQIWWVGVKGYRCGYARIPAEPPYTYRIHASLCIIQLMRLLAPLPTSIRT